MEPVFGRIKNQDSNINIIHIINDNPINQYKNKFMFHIVSRYINVLFSGRIFFLCHYSELGHGNGTPDGVGGTDKAVAKGQEIVNLS